jgi:hypothetical protein
LCENGEQPTFEVGSSHVTSAGDVYRGTQKLSPPLDPSKIEADAYGNPWLVDLSGGVHSFDGQEFIYQREGAIDVKLRGNGTKYWLLNLYGEISEHV